MSRHHSNPRTNHGNNYDADPKYSLPPLDFYASMPQGPSPMRHTPDEIAAMQAESSRQPRRLLNCLEPPIGTSGEPELTSSYVNRDSLGQPEYGHEQRRREQHDPQRREQQNREYQGAPLRKHNDPQQRTRRGPKPIEYEYKWWTPTEERELIKCVKERHNWTYIGVQLGRSANTINKHWRNNVRYSDAAQGVEYNPRR